MRIVLAPMDGLTDFYARQILTSIGGYDLCVTEFLRVTDTLFPNRVFYRRFPELKPIENSPYNISHTASNIPIFLQLLGSDPSAMADNAAKAVELGAIGIDLNFGCPAKTVNKREGGASLLKSPEKIYRLVNHVRETVPEHIPVTAKIRLGYDDHSMVMDNAQAIDTANANWLTIHARSKKDGYRPPAYWDAIAPITELIDIPIIANGEIWSVDDYLNCKERSGCSDVMLGRGAMVSPDLALQIKGHIDQKKVDTLTWPDIVKMLETLFQMMSENSQLNPKYIAPRLKLWVKWLMPNYHQAEIIFNDLKTIKEAKQAIQCINNSTNL